MEVIFDKLDMNIEEFKLLSDKYLLVPEQSAGMLIIAFYNYIKDENLGVEMIPVIVPTTIQLILEKSTVPGSSNNGSKVTW